MSSAYGKIDRPKEYDSSKLELLLPIENTTKSNQLVSVHSVTTVLKQLEDESKLICYLQSLLNKEIEVGNTYPQKFPLNLSEFKNYFLSGEAFIVINSGKKLSIDIFNNLEKAILGTFYIKPNFPGRCSHICNGGFITSDIYRNQGVAKIMALAFIEIAPLLGYKASMFNLVFANNTPSVHLWRSLGFQEIGRIPNAGYLIKKKETTEQTNAEVEEEFVDAIMFYYSFT
ncbi:unnamed protein product [Rotaria sp. Silwood1]|nr:unnamed protein product [Rotaria sp. Silwood1]CAF3713904.1 unnamed protein product [Rotaria sp. Silwood1]CAF3726037.1 unnamed protein product [Rotaria sp. Silwood1]CAF3773290.1 unnamed protein product [Rotaria sp. Silwood1]CAF4633252.1 unnamed protein product [Rotaria sp. Silwood1]